MKLKTNIISREIWLQDFGYDAHQDLFGNFDLETMPFFDFAVLVTSEENERLTYGLAKEVDRDSLYFTYGGMFSKFRNQKMGAECFHAVVDAAKSDYKRAGFATKTSNIGMIKLGFNEGFEIVGLRLIKEILYVELLKDF